MLHIIGTVIPHARIPRGVWYVVERAISEFRGESFGGVITVTLPTRFEAYKQSTVGMRPGAVTTIKVVVKPQHGYGVTFVDFADGDSVVAAQRWEERQGG